MNPALMAILTAYMNGMRAPSVGGFDSSAQMPMLAQLFSPNRPSQAFSPTMVRGGVGLGLGPNYFGYDQYAPGVPSSILMDPKLMGQLQANMDIGNWSKPPENKPQGGGGPGPGTGGILGR